MKGLILKDIYNLKQQGKFLLFFLFVWAIFSIVNKSLEFFAGAICILSITIPISACSYDERAKWNSYALSMPISQKDMVISKYCLGLLSLLFGFILCLLATGFTKGFYFENFFPLLLVSSFAILILSIMLPVLFKFGTERGRILLLIVCLLPMILAFASQGLLNPTLSPEFLNILPILFVITVILVLFGSMLLSIRIYQKKSSNDKILFY